MSYNVNRHAWGKSGLKPSIRKLERSELPDIWSIDRREFIERIYQQHDSELVLKDHYFDVPGWTPGMPERDAHAFLDCFDRGGTFYGAFYDAGLDAELDAGLIGASVLESRFIGANRDQLQLKFLHVSRQYRGTGVGRVLFETSAARAKDLGACKLYISATPSENTIRFYFSRGCQLATDIDPALFELEPEDIHLELVLE